MVEGDGKCDCVGWVGLMFWYVGYVFLNYKGFWIKWGECLECVCLCVLFDCNVYGKLWIELWFVVGLCLLVCCGVGFFFCVL